MLCVYVVADETENPVLRSAKRILSRKLQERGKLSVELVNKYEGSGLTVELCVDPNLPAESFELTRANPHRLRIVGADPNGVLYGCGRFLRISQDEDTGFRLPDSEPLSRPGKSFRGMYFAVHLHNYYHAAPLEEVTQYIEELALWGLNSLFLYFHLFHYRGLSDPRCESFVARLRSLFKTARNVGMSTGILVTANDSYLGSPPEMRYEGDVPRNWGVEVCPNKPGALPYLKKQFEGVFKAFSEIDYLNIWPYDSGGCQCDRCRPWGAKGLYVAADALAEVFHGLYPDKKIIFSSWMLDYNCGEAGEFDAMFERLRGGQLDWAEMVMADGAHVNGYFPQRVLDETVDRPLVSFLDISMRTGCPWGSFGANPMPDFIAQEWRRVQHKIIGGTPYSEGIFEDINKFIWSQLCWAPDRPIADIVEEYASSEISVEHAKTITDAIFMIEKVGRREPIFPPQNQLVLKDTTHCHKAWVLMEKVDRALPRQRRRHWRWRLLLLRALIDVELAQSNGGPTAALGRAYDELFDIYRVNDEALWYIRPYEVECADSKSGEPPYRFVQRGWKINDFIDHDTQVDEEVMVNV